MRCPFSFSDCRDPLADACRESTRLIFRFCLYGFLKNQRYFAPFWILAFLDRGLSFAMIGALIGFRQVFVTLFEIPTGAIADTVGRRWAMIFSHLAYVFAFLIFGLTSSTPPLFLGMFAFAMGEAFRTGTHKAMIFTWLKEQGREAEKTEFYGLTRSWSQIGSAVSAVLAAALVFFVQDYAAIFWLSVIPTSLNIINFLGYPKSLDGDAERPRNATALYTLLWHSTKDCLQNRRLRRPLGESMGYEGLYAASKDFLQPILHQLALSLPILTLWDSTRRTAVLIASVYTVLYLLSSAASRYAGRIAKRLGGDVRAASILWLWYGFAFGLLLVGSVTTWTTISVIAFVGLAILQNLWRPVLVSRIADEANDKALATVLSVESQLKNLGAATAAPLIGLLVDWTPAPYQFAPIALAGILVSGVAMLVPATRTLASLPAIESNDNQPES